MDGKTIAERAERLSRRRGRMLLVLALVFLTQQAAYFSGGERGTRTVDHVHVAAWLVLSIALLLALATGGGWIHPRAVRDLANDEGTRAHRNEAFRYGFFASMVGCVGLYALDLFEPLSGRDVIHLIMTVGISAALIRFAMLERRAVHDG